MKIKTLNIKGIYNTIDFKWDLDESINILSGLNGSGKTSILECLYYLSETRGIN